MEPNHSLNSNQAEFLYFWTWCLLNEVICKSKSWANVWWLPGLIQVPVFSTCLGGILSVWPGNPTSPQLFRLMSNFNDF